jgi:hypothetical protein
MLYNAIYKIQITEFHPCSNASPHPRLILPLRATTRYLQRLQHILYQVLLVLHADAQAHEPIRDAEPLARLARDAPVRHTRRQLRERLDAAQALRKREQARRAQERLRLRAGAQPERDHPAVREPAIAPMCMPVALRVLGHGADELERVRGERAARDGVPRVARQAGVDRLHDVRAALERACDGERVRAVRAHAQVQRLEPALREPAVVRARHGADRVLQEAEALEDGGAVGRDDDGAHDDVRVAVDVLGERVQDEVGAGEEGRRVEGREEGVVDEDEGVGGVRVREAHDPRDVDHAQRRVRRRLDPYQLDAAHSSTHC